MLKRGVRYSYSVKQKKQSFGDCAAKIAVWGVIIAAKGQI